VNDHGRFDEISRMPPHVRARGEASVPARPDEVRLMVWLRELRGTADEALRGAAARSEVVNALFDELEIPASSRTTAGVSVREDREYERNRWVSKGFVAEARTILRLEDPSPIGRLMSEATARADARIEGPWWSVRPSNPARAEACRQASQDARMKAGAYAESLGSRLGSILWIREPPSEAGYGGPSMRAMPMAAQAAPSPEIPIEPGEMDVSAVVEVAFALEPE
jgi:uncharacterized protein